METVAYPELALHPRPLAGVNYPHPSLENTYEPGTTESYIAQLVSSLLVASGGRTVLETGAFRGTTTAWLALALEAMGGGTLTACDIDLERAAQVNARLDALGLENTEWVVMANDVMNVIHSLPDKHLDLAWIDDNHEQHHVASEINALWPKMKPGGLMVFHDVYGVCDLQRVVKRFGGYSLNLPRLGPAGGLGLIQVP